MKSTFQSGMTLVELLVTLSILVGLATAAAVSTAGLRERANANQTTREGEGICAAIDRDVGLSFVSDFGQAPQNLGELTALRRSFYDPEVTLSAEGTVQTSLRAVQLPPFTEITAPLLPTNSLVDPSVALKATNGYDCVRLGAGWRGPYVDTKIAFVGEGHGCFADPWGGAWELDATNGIITVMSLGRDRVLDEEGVAPAWQDRDRYFSTRPTQSASLSISVRLPSSLTSTAGVRLRAYLSSPSMLVTAADKCQMEVATRELETTGENVVFTGCSVGFRVIYVYATLGDEVFSAPPQTVLITHGNTALTLNLMQRTTP